MEKSGLTFETGPIFNGRVDDVKIYGTDGENLGYFCRSFMESMIEQSERLGISINEMFRQGLAAIEPADMDGMKRAA